MKTVAPHPHRPRVLMLAEAVTLAHLARPLSLGQSLDPRLYDVQLACDPRYDAFLSAIDLPVVALHSIPQQRFLQALARGTPVYDRETLQAQVEEDLRVIESLSPDVVVGDFRLSLSISARLAGKPYIAVSNAYWSPYTRQRFPVPDLPWVRWVGTPLAQALFSAVRPLAFRIHARPMNQVRRRCGLAPMPPSLLHFYTDADVTLYADIPELFPLPGLPAHHRYIGAVLWSPPVPSPPWWHSLDRSRRTVFVSLGSSGQAHLLDPVLQALADLDEPTQTIAATAGRFVPRQVPDNALVADYLPGAEAARRSALVICNGGSPTSQQALVAGVPVLGICSNMDQYMNMEAIQRAGAGRLLRAGKADARSIRAAARDLLSVSDYASAARRLKDGFASYDAPTRFRATLDEVLTKTGAGSR
jgi:UDP:flavonoid glycosyltransferase YjiC (YdhE family)